MARPACGADARFDRAAGAAGHRKIRPLEARGGATVRCLGITVCSASANTSSPTSLGVGSDQRLARRASIICWILLANAWWSAIKFAARSRSASPCSEASGRPPGTR
jgi:hypothetical protein